MKIGIIGAGFIGRTLARLAVQHGYEAMVSNARGPASLTSTARATHARIGTVEDAAQNSGWSRAKEIASLQSASWRA